MASNNVALDFPLMLPASKGELLDQEGGDPGHIVQMQHRHRKIDRLVGDHRQEAVGRIRNFAELITHDDDLRIPFAFPSFGNDEVVRDIQEAITHFFHFQLFGDIGKQREAPLGNNHNTACTGTLMAPTILPSVSRSNPWPACLTVATRYPALTISGRMRSIKVVLPLFDRPIKETIGMDTPWTVTCFDLRAAGEPIAPGMPLLGMNGPCLTAQ